MHMKKLARMAMMAAAMFVATTAVAKAQDPQQAGGRRGGGRGMGMNIVQVLKDSLHVSDDVAAKADSIVKSYAAENQSLMEAARGGDQDARQKMMENRQKQTEAIKALLTDDQKAAFDKLMPARGRRGGGGR